MKPTRDSKRGSNESKSDGAGKRGLEASPHVTEPSRKKRLRRDTSTVSLPGAAAAAAEATPPVNTEQQQQQAQQPEIYTLPNPPEIDQQVHEAIQAMKTASPIGGKSHLNAVRTVRQLLSNYENPPALAVLSSGGISALISALQPRQSNETSVETIFEAAWALTNLAVGEPEVVKAIVPAAPVLIAHLGGGSGLAVAEQCAWALGNIAGDDVEHRETLIANGAVPPLAKLLIQGVNSAVAVATGASKESGHQHHFVQQTTELKQTPVPSTILSKDSKDTHFINLAESQRAIETGSTASWALANLLRGAGETEIAAFMSTEGASTALVNSLQIFYSDTQKTTTITTTTTTTSSGTSLPAAIENLCIETAWVLAYVTAGPEKYLFQLIDNSDLPDTALIPQLSLKFMAAVERTFEMSSPQPITTGLDEFEDTDMMAEGNISNEKYDDTMVIPENVSAAATQGGGLTVLTPLLRILGNVVAGVGSGNLINSNSRSQLIPDSQQIVDESISFKTIKNVVYCAESAHHGLQREAAWVLANYAGTSGRGGVEAVKKAGAVPALMSLLKEQPFHVRKEAAYALANICAGGGGGTGDAEALNYLFGADVQALSAMLSLLRSADVEAARLGLQFIEMVLRMLPNGAREVEAADGIDAIEALQFGVTAPQQLQAAAAGLVNKYWGVE